MLSKWNVGTNGLSCKSATEAQACVCDGSASVRVCVQTIAPYMQVLMTALGVDKLAHEANMSWQSGTFLLLGHVLRLTSNP